MGLGMKRSLWVWHGIHLGLALLIPLFLTVMVGCKKAKAFKEDLGPEVSGQAIDDALGKAVQGANFDYIRVGQFISYSSNRRLEAEETTINLGNRRIEVTNRQDSADGSQATFNLQITKSDRMGDGGFETVIFEEPLVLNVGSFSAALNDVRPTSEKALRAQVLRAMAGAPERVSYHHLRESSAVIDPPDAVKNRAGCGGLSPCKIPVSYIQFDMVIWKSTTEYQKIALDFAFSTVTPYLPFGESFDQFNGLMITDCRSTYVPIESRTVYVRDCLSIDDFNR